MNINQVTFHQFEEDLGGEGDGWGTNNNYSSVSTIPDLNLHGTPSSNRPSNRSSFTQRLSTLFNHNHTKKSSQNFSLGRRKLRSNQASSGNSWKNRPPWYGGEQREESNTLSDKEIGGYTLTTSPSHTSRNSSNLDRR